MRKLTTVGLVIAGIALSLIIAFKIPSQENDFLVRLYYGSQIVAFLVVLIGGVIGIWQYYLASKDSIRNVAILRVQKAVDLSDYYKDNVLAYSLPIDYVFKKSGINEILGRIKCSDMKDFDSCEVKRLLGDSKIAELKKLQLSSKFVESVLTANAIYDLGLHLTPVRVDKGKNSSTLTYNNQDVTAAFIRNLISGALNNMEYFAMNFNHNIADESVVYQSLHQSYNSMVTQLYYFIAIQNNDPTDKYYTNIIKLYKTWAMTKDKMVDIRSSKLESVQRNGTIIK